MRKTSALRILAAVLLVGIVSAYFFVGRTKNTTKQIFAMDAYMQFSVWGKGNAAQLSADAVSALDADFSMYADGALSKLNESGGEALAVPPALLDVIEKANLLSAKYGGRVDITSGALTKLWGVSTDEPYLPTEEEAHEAAETADFTRVQVNQDAGTVYLPAGMQIDLGGVAKGYACDRLRALYDERGVQCAIVSMGSSSSLLYGTKPDKSAFSVEIRNPDGGEGLGVLKTGEAFLSTSGGYERFFEVDGVKYTHIFDLRTGYPAKTDLTSVTVLCDGGIRSDFLSTLVYMDGTQGIQKHLEAQDYKIIAATADKRIYVSAGLDFTLNEKSGYTLEGTP